MADQPKDVMARAGEVVDASKSLDYKRIIAHDPEAVERLTRVLQRLRARMPSRPDKLDNYAQKPTSDWSDGFDPQQRREILVGALKQEGFTERLNKVYSSFASTRAIPFSQIPHRRGLPQFEFVVAPDFAPVSGLHGIFVAGNAVMSIILAADAGSANEWHVLKRSSFSSPEEMVEVVTLIAAGFDVP